MASMGDTTPWLPTRHGVASSERRADADPDEGDDGGARRAPRDDCRGPQPHSEPLLLRFQPGLPKSVTRATG